MLSLDEMLSHPKPVVCETPASLNHLKRRKFDEIIELKTK